jgi:hypothetical protein
MRYGIKWAIWLPHTLSNKESNGYIIPLLNYHLTPFHLNRIPNIQHKRYIYLIQYKIQEWRRWRNRALTQFKELSQYFPWGNTEESEFSALSVSRPRLKSGKSHIKLGSVIFYSRQELLIFNWCNHYFIRIIPSKTEHLFAKFSKCHILI